MSTGRVGEVDDYQPGKELDCRDVTLDDGLVQRYLRTVDEDGAWRADASDAGRELVPAAALAPELFSLEERSVPPSWGTNVLTASLHWQSHQQMHVGDVVSLVITVTDRRVRKGREYLTTEMTVRDTAGADLCVGDVTVVTPVEDAEGASE